MAEIEVIKTYRVGNELFNTQEEAEHYLEEQKKLVLLENPIYKDSEFHSTSYYEHYVYQGVEHEHRHCVGRFTTLAEAVNNMKNFQNSMGKPGSGYIDFVKITKQENTQGLVKIERTTILSIR